MPARKSVKASPAGEELGLELLQSVREMKARKIARVTQVQLNEVVEARQSTGVSQAVCASALGISKRTLKQANFDQISGVQGPGRFPQGLPEVCRHRANQSRMCPSRRVRRSRYWALDSMER